jgi:hypothetical protein
MTVAEFWAAADAVVADRELRPHELADVHLLKRAVQKHDNVSALEIMLLSFLGVSAHGYLVRPKPTRPKPKQASLF